MDDYQKFEIPDTLMFQKSETGLERIIIDNGHAEAVIYLFGANLTHYQPKGEKAVIFGGKGCKMRPDKTLHAGIPICWPWFGPHPSDNSKPQHGFARNRTWEIVDSLVNGDGSTKVVLKLTEDQGTLELFNHPFELLLTFIIGKKLRIELKTRNRDTKPFSMTQALHSYFYLSDIDNCIVHGVENAPFTDITENRSTKKESVPLLIDRVINRVYEPTEKTCRIVDNGLHRIITVEKEGSRATTIWNPGRENGLHDLEGELYRKFVCIESCNAGNDIVTLEPGGSHRIVQEISLSEMD